MNAIISSGCRSSVFGRRHRIQLIHRQQRFKSTNEDILKKRPYTGKHIRRSTAIDPFAETKLRNPWDKLSTHDNSAVKRPSTPYDKKSLPDSIQPISTGNLRSSGDSIDRLRNAFMQSFSAHRERAQVNSTQQQTPGATLPQNQRTDKSNSESRLDQLLRISKIKSNDKRPRSFRERNHLSDKSPSNALASNFDANVLKKELMKENSLSIAQQKATGVSEDLNKNIILPNRPISVVELSTLTREPKHKVLKTLHDIGERPPRDQSADDYKIDVDVAELIALELGLDPQRQKRTKCYAEDAEKRMLRQGNNESTLDDDVYERYPPRPAVVCICGHVDHGMFYSYIT